MGDFAKTIQRVLKKIMLKHTIYCVSNIQPKNVAILPLQFLKGHGIS